MRKKSVGDRVYFECYDGSIDSAVILDIEEMHGDTGRGYPETYYMYKTGPYTVIENYMCLADSNPRVKKYLKENKHALGFEEAFLKWMRENDYKLDNRNIQEVLYKYCQL